MYEDAGMVDGSGWEEVEILPCQGVSDEVIAMVAQEIGALQRRTGLEYAVGLGDLVFRRLYGGSLEVWRSHGPKDVSLRKLACLLPDGLSATGLYRALAIYELASRLGGFSTWHHLGAGHARAVLGLPEHEQRRLLESAEENRWTVRRLDEEAGRARRLRASRGGRPPLPGFVKSLHHLRRFTCDAGGLLEDIGLLPGLERQEVDELKHTVTTLQSRLAQLLLELEKANPSVTE